MSSVVISGDTSGSITLAAPTVAGTNTITLPATTGTMALTANPTFTGTTTLTTAIVTTLNAPSGVLATQNGMTGIAKAWVNFDSGGTILSAFNVSSVTYAATGNYTLNFTTAMANANYAYATNCIKDNNTISNGFSLQRLASGVKSTTQLCVQNMVNITVAENSVIVFGS